MMLMMRLCLSLLKVLDMMQHLCAPSEVPTNQSRLLLRLYRQYLGVGEFEALNCGEALQVAFDGNIGEHLKKLMTGWRSEGFDISAGKVDYKRLANSNVFEEFCRIVLMLRDYDLRQLETREEQLAFWINIYNVLAVHGIIAYQVSESIEEIRGPFERIAYIVNGMRFSLNDIENGILRMNQTHVAIPIPRFSVNDPRHQFVVEPLEARIHFALVCASNSCPPIGIYKADKIDIQLDTATKNFINMGGVVLNKNKLTVSLSRIFRWYSIDFGGAWMGLGSQKPVLDFIAQYVVDEDDSQFISHHATDLTVTYQSYDWSLNV
jgi:hypothetical protein